VTSGCIETEAGAVVVAVGLYVAKGSHLLCRPPQLADFLGANLEATAQLGGGNRHGVRTLCFWFAHAGRDGRCAQARFWAAG